MQTIILNPKCEVDSFKFLRFHIYYYFFLETVQTIQKIYHLSQKHTEKFVINYLQKFPCYASRLDG
jgi:hypothetical protein